MRITVFKLLWYRILNMLRENHISSLWLLCATVYFLILHNKEITSTVFPTIFSPQFLTKHKTLIYIYHKLINYKRKEFLCFFCPAQIISCRKFLSWWLSNRSLLVQQQPKVEAKSSRVRVTAHPPQIPTHRAKNSHRFRAHAVLPSYPYRKSKSPSKIAIVCSLPSSLRSYGGYWGPFSRKKATSSCLAFCADLFFQ